MILTMVILQNRFIKGNKLSFIITHIKVSDSDLYDYDSDLYDYDSDLYD